MSVNIPESEANLPENSPTQPQPTLIKVSDETLTEHKEFALKFYLDTLTPDSKHRSRQQQLLEIRTPIIRKFTVEEDESNAGRFKYSETDDKGEAKITPNGHLLNGKKWLINTFTLPGRGKELFAASTEVAKFLQIRDAFVMFTRYKQLRKLYATDEERKFLDSSSLGLSRLKSRQISLVNVKNLYMVFGCKLVAKGVRVEDDYWEDDIIALGFTPKDQVFPTVVSFNKPKATTNASINSNTASQTSKKTLVKSSNYSKAFPLTPLPSMEDRNEYLANSRIGENTQVLPGQGITGGLELASLSSHPQYRADSGQSKQSSFNKSLVAQLATTSTTTAGSTALQSLTSDHIPINSNLKGIKSNNGLPYYDSSITKRIASEDTERLREIEYLHGLVQTNSIITQARSQRTKQWKLYWQFKAGADVGLTKDKVGEFFKRRNEFMEEFTEEIRFNEYTNMDQVITKRRKPNGNYLGACTIRGLKAPYLEKPNEEETKKEEETVSTSVISSGTGFERQI